MSCARLYRSSRTVWTQFSARYCLTFNEKDIGSATSWVKYKHDNDKEGRYRYLIVWYCNNVARYWCTERHADKQIYLKKWIKEIMCLVISSKVIYKCYSSNSRQPYTGQVTEQHIKFCHQRTGTIMIPRASMSVLTPEIIPTENSCFEEL